MNRTRRAALTASSAAVCAMMVAGCGTLHAAPISNAKANDNAVAIKNANFYSEEVQAADRKETDEALEKATADPATTRKNTSSTPVWATALKWAQTKEGHRYVWGGESDAEGGFDCSGLMQAAYAQAGIRLPRVANDQYAATDVHPKWNELKPGDLVFFGETERGIHHVGLYVGEDREGNKMMFHAPNPRRPIGFNRVRYMSDYYGATRIDLGDR